jgi:prolyl oligopeptidase
MIPRSVTLVLGAAMLAACPRTPAPRTTDPNANNPPVATADAGANPSPDDDVAAWNRAARAGAVTDTVHGVSVSDPFRTLETDSPETRTWIDQQTRRSERYLSAHASPARERRLSELLDIGAMATPSPAGGRIFYRRRDAGQEQFVLMVTDPRPATAAPTTAWNNPHALIDTTRDAARYGERAAIDWYVPSPRGRYVAFGTSQNGDERSTLRVIEVATGRVLDEAIAHTKWCRLAWLANESGFYYTRYPKENENGYDAERPDTYWRRMYFHRLGNGPDGASDPLVFEGTERTDAPSPYVSADGRWLVVNLFKGWTKSEVLLVDRNARVAAGQKPRAVPVAVGHESLNHGAVYRGRLYLHTNRDAPKYRILAASADALYRTAPPPVNGVSPQAIPPEGPWRIVVPEREHPLEEFAFAGTTLAVHYLENITSRVRVLTLDGANVGEIPLSSEGSVQGIATQDDEPVITFSFTSFFVPNAVLAADTRMVNRRGLIAPSVVDHPTLGFDLDQYELERATVNSADGTPVNVFFMHRRGMERNHQNPVLLNGYGGFNISLAPRFTRQALYWMERGGVYAVANLRGGAEFGEGWHRAGMRENKHHVFEDFEAVIRWFSTSGISAPERIAIHGGSNGGLLMGAMVTRCPDAFRAAYSDVGLYDMVRFHRFPPAEIWTSEYGTPEEPEAFRYLHEYSPYHRLTPGTRYPAVWVSTADHDTRVYWGHSTKFAALLQESQAAPHPIYFYMERDVGHGAGMQRSDQLRAWTRMFTFLEDQLGLGSP